MQFVRFLYCLSVSLLLSGTYSEAIQHVPEVLGLFPLRCYLVKLQLKPGLELKLASGCEIEPDLCLLK